MKKRLKLYLETTIPNYIFADDTPEKQKITLRFWDEVRAGQYEVFVSEVVLGEIKKTKDLSKREKLLKIIEGIPFLDLTEECRNLAEIFIEKGVIPSDYEPDALHIAIGIIHQMDAIVSWNLEHIVNIETKLAVRKIAKDYNYKDVEIGTPEEVITHD
ncbi:MAG: type II toxin-antitoxin system VapC family toxin [bacterium]|nr:type II toxin-antitoxin system VapC family toxin [bacterium]